MKNLAHFGVQGQAVSAGAEGGWFFITINCVPPGKNQLCRTGTGEAVLAAVKHNHQKGVWHCRLCVLMPDHLHAILAFPSRGAHGVTRPTWLSSAAGYVIERAW